MCSLSWFVLLSLQINKENLLPPKKGKGKKRGYDKKEKREGL